VSTWDGRDRDAAQRRGFLSAHLVLRVTDGAFVSLTDPPADLSADAAACHNVGLWPVLVGTEGDRDTILASPIILYDYPQIAPESPGLLFDSGEIDQLLLLNTLALTDAEKQEVRGTDPRARDILDRAEAMTSHDFAGLHGVMREIALLAEETPPASVVVNGTELRPGAHVRLHPHPGGDIFDLALDGRLAIVEAIEQDFDERVHLAVTLPDDPGRDLGMDRMPGHRFFFSPDEVEPVV
jgi:hydrogenase maturation protease